MTLHEFDVLNLSSKEAAQLGLTLHEQMRAHLTGEMPARMQQRIQQTINDQTEVRPQHRSDRASLLSEQVEIDDSNFRQFLDEAFYALDLLLRQPQFLAAEQTEIVQLLQRMCTTTYQFYFKTNQYRGAHWQMYSRQTLALQARISDLLDANSYPASEATLLALAYELSKLNLAEVSHTHDIFTQNLSKQIINQNWTELASLISIANSTCSFEVVYALSEAHKYYKYHPEEASPELTIQLLQEIAMSVIARIKQQNQYRFTKPLIELDYVSWIFQAGLVHQEMVLTALPDDFKQQLAHAFIDAYTTYDKRIRGGEPPHTLSVKILRSIETALTLFSINNSPPGLLTLLKKFYTEKVVAYSMEPTVLNQIKRVVNTLDDLSMTEVKRLDSPL